MRLSDLDKGGVPAVVLLQTPSTRLQMFLRDKVKTKIQFTQECEITVTKKTDYKSIREILGVVPPFSDKWFIEIDLDKLNDSALTDLIKISGTCCFFCTCSSYRIYKNFKDALQDEKNMYDFYINFLRRPDMVYLYDALTLSDNKLSKSLFDFVVQGYSGDLDMVFNLFLAMNEGKKFESRKDIIEYCGLGGLTVDSLIFSLLKPVGTSDKGLKTVIKNRIKALMSLGENLGYSTLYNYMSKALMCLSELKMLTISGVVYKEVRKLPGTFDEKSLSRYQRHLWRLQEIPLSDLLVFKQCMGGTVWRSEMDGLKFIYTYYGLKGARACQ